MMPSFRKFYRDSELSAPNAGSWAWNEEIADATYDAETSWHPGFGATSSNTLGQFSYFGVSRDAGTPAPLPSS